MPRQSCAVCAWRETCARRARKHAPRYDAPGDKVYAPALLLNG